MRGRFHTLVIMSKRKLLGYGLIHQFGYDLGEEEHISKDLYKVRRRDVKEVRGLTSFITTIHGNIH